MGNVTVVGAGAVGTAVALEIESFGHNVKVIAREVAGQLDKRSGVTTEWAAGIGCIFKPSSPLVSKLVLDSYEDWMSMARDAKYPYIMETDLKIVTKPNEEVSYANQVSDFHRVDETTAQYTTYSLNPSRMLEARLEELRKKGVVIERRSLTADEITQLKDGVALDGSDYTVEATGLAARDYRPELGLYPIAGVLAHFIDPATGELRDSYMDEDKARYVITRPSPHGREIVVGGTFLEGVGSMSEEEVHHRGQQIVDEAIAHFQKRGLDGTRLVFPRDWSVGFRPGRSGDPVTDVGEKVAVVTGFGGQGIVTNPAVSRLVATLVNDRLPKAGMKPGVTL